MKRGAGKKKMKAENTCLQLSFSAEEESFSILWPSLLKSWRRRLYSHPGYLALMSGGGKKKAKKLLAARSHNLA